MGVESSLRLLDYINKVAKEPIILEGNMFGHLPPLTVTLTDKFFIKDDCVMCGRCCLNETTVWTESGIVDMESTTKDKFDIWGLDYQVIQEVKKGLVLHYTNINGKEVAFFIHPRDKASEAFKLGWVDRNESPRCHWLFEREGTYRCRLHPIRSITCKLPHLRFNHHRESRHTTLRVAQYGRNWALKCPVSLTEVDEKSTLDRIKWLKTLYNISIDVGVKTFLPEIIEYLDKGNRHAKDFYLNNRKKLFTVGGK